MTKAQMVAKFAEMESRIAYLEGALDSISGDGDELGLWEQAKAKRRERAVIAAAKSREQFPIRKNFQKKVQTDTEWVQSKKAALLELQVKRDDEMKAMVFPVSLETALRKWIGGDAADRMPIYRKYLRETLPIKSGGKPFVESFNFYSHQAPTLLADDSSVEKYLAQERSGKCFNERNWSFLTARFDMWHYGYKERVKRERAKSAADARWKNNSENSLVRKRPQKTTYKHRL